MITEIYISIDGLEFTKLDLLKDESIPMQYTTKDLQDISKVFAPYSQNFTFEASPKNRKALGFFGDTDVIKINHDNKYTCKIYTNGSLSLQGFLTVESLQYQNNYAKTFTASFATSIKNLKDKIGDTLISDLGTLPVFWKPNLVEGLLKATQTTNIEGVTVKYFVPLISSNRVLSIDPTYTAGLKDNIAYNVANSPTSINLLTSNELRPAVTMSSLIELIKLRYNLLVTTPLDSRNEYKDAYLWCNSENLYNSNETKLVLKNNLGAIQIINGKNESDIPDPKKYLPTVDVANGNFNVIIQEFDNNWDKHFTFEMGFENVVLTAASSDTPSVTVKIKRVGNNEVLTAVTFDILSSTLNIQIPVVDEYFVANNLDFYVTVQFNQPTSWSNMIYDIYFNFYDGKYGPFNAKRYATYLYASYVNNNSDDISATKIDLFKALPPIKVIDFLTSYFKTYNINMFDSSPNDDRLFWLTPSDVNTDGLEYSKTTVDYTPYIDFKSKKKETPSKYNYYNFKHATSKFRSNVDYLKAAGQEYGQVTYPEIKPDSPVEYKVETSFSLIPPVLLNGTSDVITYYGFNSDAPEYLETGEARYKPNYGELAIFYLNGSQTLTVPIGFQSQAPNGVLINSSVGSYLKCLPFNNDNQSLGFSILRFLNVSYTDSLYQRYYANQISRLLNPNVLSQEFTAVLPSNELYLNNATSVQGGGNTPVGFRLQNDVIVGENLFSILEANIDITTGKTSLKLLNY